MVTKNENGKLKFDLASAINLIPIIITILVSAIALSGQIARMETRLSYAESSIIELMEFKNKDRFTRLQGDELKERICALEDWAKNSPPKWFQEMYREFRIQITNSVTSLGKEVNDLKVQMKSLESTLKTHAKE